VPELPEVAALAQFVAAQATGRVIERVEVAAISALKTFDPPIEALAGRTITGAGRIGKYLLIEVEGLTLTLHLSRGGWVRWVDNMSPGRVKPGKGPLALRIRLEGGGGFDVTEAGTEKRLSAWLVTDPRAIEQVATLGPDPMDPSFTAATLREILSGQKGQLKGVLTSQSVLAGVGNAYSDEALFVARLSPFKRSDSLTEDEVTRLHAALIGVLDEAADAARGLPASGLKQEKKAGLRVHGRTGQACGVCGDTIREVAFATKSLQYCATCQTGGKILADRRLSRLLK
jgi:formamidopyrimidine-DNA glycosylase